MIMNQFPISLSDVIINSELLCRTPRLHSDQAEKKALIALAEILADSPDMVLQKIVEAALQLCSADTAGISLKHNGVEVFRREAPAGVHDDRVNSTMPRNASPCATTIDHNTTLLMHKAERLFPALKAEPPVVEALLVPFQIEHKPIGTVWVATHDEHRKFDREDERIIKTLAQFASSAWQLWQARTSAEAIVRSEQKRTSELAAANEGFQVEIGERKRAEGQLEELNMDLVRRVEKSTAQLVTANADLLRALEEERRLREQLRHSQKMNTIGTLAGGLAHDFNNLLNIIQAYALAIMRHTTDAKKVVEDVNVIRETVGAGADLVQQLLTVARKSEVKFVPTDINGLLQRLSKMLTETFPKSLTITLEFDPKLPNVKVGANQITQVLLNLCINARDAMPHGGNLLLRSRTLSGAELCDRFHQANSERYVCISVADTGSGMEEEIKSRIFEPFFTTKEPGEGTGLGLSVVYDIISNQDGFIEVTSEPGRGSTFHIYLPIPKDEAEFVKPALGS
jgi:signal transduction histidine kinase